MYTFQAAHLPKPTLTGQEVRDGYTCIMPGFASRHKIKAQSLCKPEGTGGSIDSQDQGLTGTKGIHSFLVYPLAGTK